jgi:hypothetical protein
VGLVIILLEKGNPVWGDLWVPVAKSRLSVAVRAARVNYCNCYIVLTVSTGRNLRATCISTDGRLSLKTIISL